MGSRLRQCVPAAVLVVLSATAGCGGGTPAPAPAPPAAPTPTASPQEQALAWTGSVCSALAPVVGRLTAAPPLDLEAPEATRQAYLTYLAEGLTVTDRARDALALAGPAPVADGAALAEQVRGEVADLRAHLVDARTQVQRADPGSAVAVGRAVAGMGNLVGALLNGAQVAGTINRDPALHEAYDRTPACAVLQRSGTAPAPVPATPTR